MLEELPSEWVRLATPLAGGIGCSHEDACGALTGGVMVIGALHGRADATQNDDLAQSLALTYRDRFHEEFGTTCCGPIRDWVHAPGGPDTCSVVVERAAGILLEVLSG